MHEAVDVSLLVSSAVWHWAPQKLTSAMSVQNNLLENLERQLHHLSCGHAVTKGINLIFSGGLWNTMVWQGASVIFVELYSSCKNGALSFCRRWTQISWHIFQIALLVHGRIFLYANIHGGDWEPVCMCSGYVPWGFDLSTSV